MLRQEAAAHCKNKPSGLDVDDVRVEAGHFLDRKHNPQGFHCHINYCLPSAASWGPDACSYKPSSSPGVDLKGA